MKTDENGALYVPMQTDNKEFIGAMNEAERRVKGFSDATVESGAKVNKVLTDISRESVKMGNNFQTHAKREIGLIADIEKHLQDLREKKRNAFSVEDIEKYNKKIQEAEYDLKGLNDAGKKTSETNESLAKSIGKWALTLGGASAALSLLKKAFQETTGGMNLFNIIGAGTKQILYDIASGAGLSSAKLGQAVALQREMNDLRLKEYVDAIKAAKYNNEYQQLYSDSLDATLTRTEKIATIDNALAAHNKAIDIQVENVRERMEKVKKGLDLQPSNEKLLKEYSDLIVALENLEAGRVSSTKRLTRQRSILIKEGIDEELEWKKDLHDKLNKLADEQIEIDKDRSEKLRDLNNEIATGKLDGMDKDLLKLKQKYDIDMDTYKDDLQFKKALTEKYEQDKYEIEKKYLDKLQKDNERFVETMQKIDPGKGYSILNRAINRPASTSAYGGTNKTVTGSAMGQLRPFDQGYWDARNKKQIDQLKTEEELLAEQLEKRREIIGAAADLTNQIAQQIGLTEEQQQSLDATFAMLEEGLSGNWIALAANLMSQLVAIIPSHAKEFASEIEHINQLLAEQERLIQQSERSGNQKGAEQTKLDLLNKQKKATEAEIAKTQKNLNGFFGAIYAGTGSAKRLEKLKQDLIDINHEIEDTDQSLDDLMRGGIVENDLADMITRAMIEGGLAGSRGIAQGMKDILGPALIQIFKDQYLLPMINKELMPLFDAFAEDGEITTEEVGQLVATAQSIAEKLTPALNAILSAYGGSSSLSGANALSGAIKGVSESTASAVAGQMNAMRLAQADLIGISRQQLFHLSEIAVNSRYNKFLELIYQNTIPNQSSGLRSQGIS